MVARLLSTAPGVKECPQSGPSTNAPRGVQREDKRVVGVLHGHSRLFASLFAVLMRQGTAHLSAVNSERGHTAEAVGNEENSTRVQSQHTER